MTDIRLEEMPFDFEGNTYILRCNMNVLAEVQDAYGGDLVAAMDSTRPTATALTFLAAMMNDYADEKGWPQRFTSKSLGRKLGFSALPMSRITEIMSMVFRALTPPDSGEKTDEKAAASDKGSAGN